MSIYIYTFDSTTHPNSSGDILFHPWIMKNWYVETKNIIPGDMDYLLQPLWSSSIRETCIPQIRVDTLALTGGTCFRTIWSILSRHVKAQWSWWSSYGCCCCCCCCCCWSCCRCGGGCGICCDQQMECDTEIPVDDLYIYWRGELQVPAGNFYIAFKQEKGISNSAYHSSFVLHLILKEINIDKPCQSCFVLFKWHWMFCCAPESSMVSSTSWWRLTVAIAAAMPAGESWSPGNSVGYPWTDTPNMILNPGQINKGYG